LNLFLPKSIRDETQRYKHKELISKRKKIKKYLVDETLTKADSELIWLSCIAIKLTLKINNSRTFIKESKERNIFVGERFLSVRFDPVP